MLKTIALALFCGFATAQPNVTPMDDLEHQADDDAKHWTDGIEDRDTILPGGWRNFVMSRPEKFKFLSYIAREGKNYRNDNEF